jgi:DNA/RNA-binding domain of Phe-tRNA-synthetase-like protein
VPDGAPTRERSRRAPCCTILLQKNNDIEEAPVLTYSPAFAHAYAGCCFGGLEITFDSPPTFSDALKAEIARRESAIVEEYGEFSRGGLKALPVISEYVRHFKRFKKSYHVLLQLASAAEGKPVPRLSALVSIMLTAELSNFVLSSGHDLDVVSTPMTFEPGSSDRHIDLLGGRSQGLKDGDITLRDGTGETTLAAVVYGQSIHGMIDENTTHAVYVAYGVPGIGERILRSHLEDTATLVKLCGGGPRVEEPLVLTVE